MSIRFFAAVSATLILVLSSLAHAQSTPAPAAPVAAPTAAPEKAASSDIADGKVAYYGQKFNGRKTASGERFNSAAMTMAHKTLPFGTLVKVTNVKNSKSVTVRVNDRGPSTPDRVGDLSAGAASKIRMVRSGVIDAKLEIVSEPKARTMKKAKTMGKKKTMKP